MGRVFLGGNGRADKRPYLVGNQVWVIGRLSGREGEVY